MMNRYRKGLLLALMASLFTQVVIAGSIKTGNPERERSNKEAMSESVYKKFVKLQEMYADGKYSEARAGFEAMSTKRLNDFEKANVNQFLGWVDYAEEKYKSASKHLQIAIDSDALPNQAHFSMMLQQAQIIAASGDYPKAIAALKKYYKVVDEIKDSTFYFEASLYAQMEKYRPAIKALKKSIELADKPIESRIYLLFNLHMQLSEFKQAAKALETLIALNPNKRDYWIKLSEVYFTLKKDDKSLATLILADKNGLLTKEKDRIKLFKMYAFLGVPYKAGKVLESGLKSGVIEPNYKRWEDLGSIWYTAAEMDKSLAAYNEASKLAKDGKIDFRRAYIYLAKDDWKSARDAFLSALEKGGLKEKKIGTAYLLLGMAESEMKNSSAALRYLKKAVTYKNVRNSATQWINHIEKQLEEAKRRAAVEKALADERAANEILDQ